MANDNDEKSVNFQPVLELPPVPDSPGSSIGSFLAEDSMAPIMSKVAALEAFLRLITRDCTFHDFMRELLLIVVKAIKVEAGSILEVDHVNQTLFFRSVVGQSSDRLTKFIVPVGQGLAGHVAESHQPVVVNDISENKVHLKSIQDAVGFDARNLVALPLVIRGKAYGVLELLNRVGEESFTPNDLELLNYLADIMGKAIEARLMIAWGARKAENGRREAA